MGFMDDIMGKMTDKEGLFQGGRGGRMLGRARDVMGQHMPDTEGLEFRSKDLEDFQKGTLEEGTRTRSGLLRGAFKGKDVYAGGQKRGMTLADLGFEGDPMQDPTRWGELFEFGRDFSKSTDPVQAEEWHNEAIQRALEEGYKGDDFGDVWNKYGMPHITGARGALLEHGRKTGDITGDILAGGDAFNVRDLVQRSGMAPDIRTDRVLDRPEERGMMSSLRSRASDEEFGTLPRESLTREQRWSGDERLNKYGDFRGYKDVGEYSQREAERGLRRGGFRIDSRIEEAGY